MKIRPSAISVKIALEPFGFELLVWDENRMSHKNAIEALNRTLQDLRDSTDIMGGMAGDFGQTLPLKDQLPYADSITPFISPRAPLKYYGVLLSDITLTTDFREKTNIWIPLSNMTRVKFEVKEGIPTPREWRGQSV
ncbi:hypothetical protein TNCV_1155211 [Trichonephila clavipes]|nr:hypothetical protein TNCV_1155211 [Trichonephila clavipes]